MGLGMQSGSDMDRYELGKAIVAGRRRGSKAPSVDELRELEVLQQKLPLSAKKSVDLTKLQGLSAEEWIAVRYFLELRYKVK